MDKQLKSFLIQISPAIIFVALLWVIHSLQYLLGADWSEYGIYPQAIDGLWGIILGPLLHANWTHLIANSAPMLLTGVLILTFFPSIAFRAFVMLYFFTGVMVWLFAREVYHIGASGVVYAMVSFLFWSGVFRRSPRSIFLGLMILTLYGSMFEGILPEQPHVSWESHLFGGLVGIAVAYYFKDELEEEELPKTQWQHVPYNARPFFLSRDAFEYTKAQRYAMEEERRRLEEEYRQQLLLQQWQNNEWNSNHT